MTGDKRDIELSVSDDVAQEIGIALAMRATELHDSGAEEMARSLKILGRQFRNDDYQVSGVEP